MKNEDQKMGLNKEARERKQIEMDALTDRLFECSFIVPDDETGDAIAIVNPHADIDQVSDGGEGSEYDTLALKDIESLPLYDKDIWVDGGKVGLVSYDDNQVGVGLLSELFTDEELKAVAKRIASLRLRDALTNIPTKPSLPSELDLTIADRLLGAYWSEVHFPDEDGYLIITLWTIAHTWLNDLRFISDNGIETYPVPVNTRLNIKGPIGSGKTSMEKALRRYVRKGVKVDDLTVASMFRLSHHLGCTLVLDEAQDKTGDHEERDKFIKLGFDHDKFYIRAHKEDAGYDQYYASVPVAMSMKTAYQSEDSISRCVSLTMRKAPKDFHVVKNDSSKLYQDLLQMRMWAFSNTKTIYDASVRARELLEESGIHHRDADRLQGMCMVALLFDKPEWTEMIVTIGLYQMEDNLFQASNSLDGAILEAIEVLGGVLDSPMGEKIKYSEIRQIIIEQHDTKVELSHDMREKVRNIPGYITNRMNDLGFAKKRNNRGDYRIDWDDNKSIVALQNLREKVYGPDFEATVHEESGQGEFMTEVNSMIDDLTNKGFKKADVATMFDIGRKYLQSQM